ncbi:MAG TPA: hypothetical protein EYM87_04245 [Candidatus Marinimicrobia bacterium]|nr:hypothetical protein [Candidatus Neomarinimicrobiota bacterium]
MISFEDKLNSLADREVAVPDADEFLEHLHGTIRKREQKRQSLISGVTAVVIFLAVGFGVYRNADRLEEIPFFVNGESYLIAEFDDDEIEQYNIVFDEELVYASAEYLLEGADVFGSDWELLKELDDANIINLEYELTTEKQS